MRAKWTGVLCGSLVLLSLPAWGAGRNVERVAAMEEFQQNRKVAIVVGVEQYSSNLGFKPLYYAVDDAKLIAQTLQQQGYKVQLLTDSQATRDAILDRIEQVGKTLPEGDGTLIFYFSGHGLAENNTNYLASFGAVAGRLQSSALSLKEVEAEIRKTQAPRAVLFIDACRDPLPTGSKGANRGFIYEKSEGMKVLFATKFGEKSYERDELKQGVFSHFLNRALRGQAAEADGLITFDSLTRYVQQGTADWTLEHLKTTQLPYTQDLKENFGVLVLGQTTPTAPPSSEPEPRPAAPTVVATPPTRPASPTNTRLPFEPVMVSIPAGSFMMGCVEGRDDVDGGCEADEKPAHQVSLSAFQIGKYEVTFDEWDACERAKACPHAEDEGWGRGKRPVTNVSWNDITQNYIPWLNQQTGTRYRLPTEAEWEYAARAGGESAYPWGNSINCDKANYYECKPGGTVAVGSYPANVWGLHDTAGNVWEWVQDWYGADYYRSSPASAPEGPSSGTYRVLRGGSWFSTPSGVRSANRHGDTPDSRNYGIGFRVAQG